MRRRSGSPPASEDDVDDARYGQRLFVDQRAQRAPGDQLHRDVDDAAVLADLVDRCDVGVAHRSDALRLAQKPSPTRAVGDEVGRQHLEGHRAAKRGVPGAVHDAHSAATEHLLDAKLADGAPD